MYFAIEQPTSAPSPRMRGSSHSPVLHVFTTKRLRDEWIEESEGGREEDIARAAIHRKDPYTRHCLDARRYVLHVSRHEIRTFSGEGPRMKAVL